LNLSRSLLVVSSETIGVAAISVGALLCYSHFLQPSDFGLGSLTFSISSLVEIVAAGLFYTPVVQSPREDDDFRATAIFLNLAAAIVAAALVFAFGQWGAGKLSSAPSFALLLKWSALGVFVNVAQSVAVAEAHRRLRFAITARRSLVGKGAGALAGVATAISGGGAWAFVIQNMAGALAALLVTISLIPILPRGRFHWADARGLMGYGAVAAMANAFGNSSYHVFTALSAASLGIQQMGFVSLAVRFIETLRYLISGGLGVIAFPMLSARIRSGRDMNDVLLRGVRLTSLIASPLFILLGAAAPQLVELLVGDAWRPAILPMRIFCATAVISIPVSLCLHWLMASGRPRKLVVINLGMLCWTMAAVLAVRPNIAWAAALIWASQAIVTTIFSLNFVRTSAGLKIGPLLAAIARSIACALLGASALLVTAGRMAASSPASDPWARLILSGALGLAVYVCAAQFGAREALKDLIRLLGELALSPVPVRAGNAKD
jgi:PST family polysaccharide transporter